MTMKAIGYCMFIGENSYLSDNWNRLDGSLVVVGIIDTLASPFVGSQNKIFGMLRLLRLFKALKPLRVIHRTPGLKLVVSSLLISLKPIGNIVLICFLFFLIFGILGVQVT